MRKPLKISRTSRPEGMTLEEWQIELRRQHGREQEYRIKNLGDHPVLSEFLVGNPQSKTSYRVRIRGNEPGQNACTCPDFATNTLGTCKHIEFALGKIARRRGGIAALNAGFSRDFSEIFLEYDASRAVRFRPGVSCSKDLSRLAADYFSDEGFFRPELFPRFNTFLDKAYQLESDLHCAEDVLDFCAEVVDAQERRTKIATAFPRGTASAAFNDLLKVPLYDYQREGALFAAKSGRCLIGDEMGLGKTIQALAAAEIMAQQFGVERVLIVCPTSLKHQWQREIEKFTTRHATVVGGMRPERRAAYLGKGTAAAKASSEALAGQNPLANFLQSGLAGLQLLQKLADAPDRGELSNGLLVQTDTKTGERFLRLALPSSDVLENVILTISKVVKGLQSKSTGTPSHLKGNTP